MEYYFTCFSGISCEVHFNSENTESVKSKWKYQAAQSLLFFTYSDYTSSWACLTTALAQGTGFALMVQVETFKDNYG